MKSLIFERKNGIIFGSLLALFAIAILPTNICAQNYGEVEIEASIDEEKTAKKDQPKGILSIAREKFEKYKLYIFASTVLATGILSGLYFFKKPKNDSGSGSGGSIQTSEALKAFLKEKKIEVIPKSSPPSDIFNINLSNNLNDFKVEWLKELKNLKDIIISNSGLTAIPKILKDVKALGFVDLSNNELDDKTDYHKWFNEQKNLKYLYLSGNKLTKIPNVIKSFDGLMGLECRGKVKIADF